MRYSKFFENLIDREERPHLKEDDESSDSDEQTDEQVEDQYKVDVTSAIDIALGNLGIGAKAETNELLSAMDNEDAPEQEDGSATSRRKGLKLPALYGSE